MVPMGRPRSIFEPHPVLGWKLAANRSLRVPFRPDVIQTTGPDGWRSVADQPSEPIGRLVFYGCSFTYGVGLTDDETFPSLVQSHLPDITVENKGVSGHGTVQNYLQFRDDVRRGAVQAAVFGLISGHRYRNLPHPSRMNYFLSLDWHTIGVEHVPRVRADREGRLQIEYVPIWQPALLRNDFDAFLPDEYMVDRATVRMVEMVLAHAEVHNIPAMFALLDGGDRFFNSLMLREVGDVIDVSAPMDQEHTFLPHDGHPNEAANRLFAERLLPRVITMCNQAMPR